MLKIDNPASVCIVGNGISLKGRSLGSVIDDHECVVRCNFFMTNGYEEDTGRKTTHWLMSSFFATRVEIDQRKDCSGFKEVWVCPMNRPVPVETILNNVKCFCYLSKSLLASENIDFLPTTGLVGIGFAIQRWKKRIDLVGFGRADRIETPHYEHNRNPSWTGHNLESERLLINKWVERGLVRRIDEDCNSIS